MTRGLGEGDVVEHDVPVLHLLRRRASSVVLAVQQRKHVVGGLLRQFQLRCVCHVDPDVLRTHVHRHHHHEHLREGHLPRGDQARADGQQHDQVHGGEEERKTLPDGGAERSLVGQTISVGNASAKLGEQGGLKVVRVDGVDVQQIVSQLAGALREELVHSLGDARYDAPLQVLHSHEEGRECDGDDGEPPVARGGEAKDKSGDGEEDVLDHGVHAVDQVADAATVDAESRGERGGQVVGVVEEDDGRVDELAEAARAEVGDQVFADDGVALPVQRSADE